MVELNFTFVYFAVSFIFFILLMKIIFFDKVAEVINNRDQLIDQNLKASQLTSKQMEEQLAISSSSSILKTARDEAQSIINFANNQADTVKSRVLQEAKNDISQRYEHSLRTMEFEKNQVLSEIDSIVSEISSAMTSKLLEELSTGKKAIGV